MDKARHKKNRLNVRLFFRLLSPEYRMRFENLAKHHGYEMEDWNGLAIELARLLYPKLFSKKKKKGYEKIWNEEDEYTLFHDVQVTLMKNPHMSLNSAFVEVAAQGNFPRLKTAKSVESKYKRIAKSGKFTEAEFRAVYRKWSKQKKLTEK